jgi:hypothetical protein
VGYDARGRVAQTVVAQGSADERVVTPGEPDQMTRFTYAGGGDGAFGILDATGALVEATVGLPDGATVRIDAVGAAQDWAYPNLHGDVILGNVVSGSIGTLWMLNARRSS